MPILILAEWANPYSHAPKSSEMPYQNSGGYYKSKGGELKLEWDVQKTHMSVMVKCPQMFCHIVYCICLIS